MSVYISELNLIKSTNNKILFESDGLITNFFVFTNRMVIISGTRNTFTITICSLALGSLQILTEFVIRDNGVVSVSYDNEISRFFILLAESNDAIIVDHQSKASIIDLGVITSINDTTIDGDLHFTIDGNVCVLDRYFQMTELIVGHYIKVSVSHSQSMATLDDKGIVSILCGKTITTDQIPELQGLVFCDVCAFDSGDSKITAMLTINNGLFAVECNKGKRKILELSSSVKQISVLRQDTNDKFYYRKFDNSVYQYPRVKIASIPDKSSIAN